MTSRRAPQKIVAELGEALENLDAAIERGGEEALFLQTWIRPSLRRSLAWARGDDDWRDAGRYLS